MPDGSAESRLVADDLTAAMADEAARWTALRPGSVVLTRPDRKGCYRWDDAPETPDEAARLVRRFRPAALTVRGDLFGLAMVDFDFVHGGDEWHDFVEWSVDHGYTFPPDAVWQSTPSGGRHVFMLDRSDGRIGKRTGHLGPIPYAKVDTFGARSRWVTPVWPTPGYPWLTDDGLAPDLSALPVAPDWLFDPPAKPHVASASRSWDSTDVDGARRFVVGKVRRMLGDLHGNPTGQRARLINDIGFEVGQAAGAGVVTRSEANAILLDAEDVGAGLPDYEGRNRVRSQLLHGFDRGLKKPGWGRHDR